MLTQQQLTDIEGKIRKLPEEKMGELRDFIEFLLSKGKKKKKKARFAELCGVISDEDAEQMSKAIEQGCEIG